jgi:polysaccharide transporter, PST family
LSERAPRWLRGGLDAVRRTGLGHTIASLYGLQFATYVLPVISFPYLTRVLGPERFGLYVFVLVIARYLILITDYGFIYTATRDIAVARAEHRDVGRIYGSVVVARLLLLSACGIVLLVLTTTVEHFQQDASLYWIAFAAGAGSALLPTWLYQGFERLPFATGVLVGFRTLGVLLIFVLVHSGDDLSTLMWLYSAPWLAAAAVTLWAARARLGVRFRVPTPGAVAHALRAGFGIFVAILASSLYLTSNVIFLGLLTNNAQVGFFGAAEAVITAVKGLVDPLSQALFPRASQIGARGREAALRYGRMVLRWIGGLGLVLSVLTLALSPLLPVVTGGKFENSVTLLQIMSVLPLAQALIIVFGAHLMLPLRMDRTYSTVVLIGGLLNVALTLILVPGLEATGTAIAVAVTESTIALTLYLLLRHLGLDVLRTAPAPGPA